MGRFFAVLSAALLVACAAGAGVGETSDAAKVPAALLRGRCHCGAVRFEARGPVVKCTYCDCRDCQRASGSLKTPYVTVRRAGFRATAGTPATFRARGGVKCDRYGTWYFCRKCGGPLYWQSDNGKEMDVFAGSLDDPSVFRPAE